MTDPSAESPSVKKSSELTVLLDRAGRFLERHAGTPGIDDTYGYFTKHPVAPLNRARLDAMVSEIRRLRERRGRPLRILDLACGGGLISCLMTAESNTVLGYDLSENEIRLADRFASEFGYPARFAVKDLISDPGWERDTEHALGGKPDCVILAYALHHLPEVETFVARLGAWLDPGAVVLINEENPRSPTFRLKHAVRGVIQRDTETEWHRTYSQWRALFERERFQVSRPNGFELLPLAGPLLERIAPGACWSLVFTAERS